MKEKSLRLCSLIQAFKDKFGDAEVTVPEITVVSDPRCGSGGISKIRVRNNEAEYYLNWWAYGWYDDYKYPDEIEEALSYAIYRVKN